MTLATNMWILDPVAIDDIWPVGRALIHELSDRSGPAEFSDRPSYGTSEFDGLRTRGHGIGQGFCSMYDVDYHADGGVIQDGTITHESWCDDPCDDEHARDAFPAYVRIEFDTTYGYRDSRGWGCGDLHAALVGAIGRWCDERGLRWCWENEFTGEIHQGADGLDELGRGGADAQAWMLSVLPAAYMDWRIERTLEEGL